MATPTTQALCIYDATTNKLTPQELTDLNHALALGLKEFNESPWVQHGYVRHAVPVALAHGAKPPQGAWVLNLLNDSTEAGALGYHEEGPHKIPFSDVFVDDCRKDGIVISSCMLHEAYEMLCDPFVEYPQTVKHDGNLYIVEVADPVEGCEYELDNTGLIGCDFVWPRWFGLEQGREEMSQRASIAEPFQLAPGGYISIQEPGQEWKQIFGEDRKYLPQWASRLPRIHPELKVPGQVDTDDPGNDN